MPVQLPATWAKPPNAPKTAIPFDQIFGWQGVKMTPVNSESIGTRSWWTPEWKDAIGKMSAADIQAKLPDANWDQKKIEWTQFNAGKPLEQQTPWDEWVRKVGLGYSKQLGFSGAATTPYTPGSTAPFQTKPVTPPTNIGTPITPGGGNSVQTPNSTISFPGWSQPIGATQNYSKDMWDTFSRLNAINSATGAVMAAPKTGW